MTRRHAFPRNLRTALNDYGIVVEIGEPELAVELELAGGRDVASMSLVATCKGDACFIADGLRVGCERKTASDLVAAWTDKQKNGRARLENQLERMFEYFDIVVLFIEGTLVAGPRGSIVTDAPIASKKQWNGLWNHLLRLRLTAAKKGSILVIEPTASVEHTARRVLSLQSYISKLSRRRAT